MSELQLHHLLHSLLNVHVNAQSAAEHKLASMLDLYKTLASASDVHEGTKFPQLHYHHTSG